MARYSFALCLMIACVAFAQDPAPTTMDGLCEQECVAAVYSTYCGGARCIHDASPGRDQFLCQSRCLTALSGSAMSNCIASIPSLSSQSNELPIRISAEVRNYCENVVGVDISPGPLPEKEVDTPTTEAPVTETPVSETPTVDVPEAAEVPETIETPTLPPVSPPVQPPIETDVEEPETSDEEPESVPSLPPVEPPTEIPTETPIVEPIEEPIVEPTETPIVEPTEEPIVEPTEEPIVEPTEEPIVEPAEEPEIEPAASPSVGDIDFDEMEERIQDAIEDGLL